MATLTTTHFGFTAVKEQVPSTNDWAATYGNWITADAILNGLISHQHTGAVALANPSGAATLSSTDTGGTIKAGTTYYFITTFLDSHGAETFYNIQNEVSLTTPPSIGAPSAPTNDDVSVTTDIQAHSGGLVGGAYWYKLTYKRGGGETTASPPLYVVIPTDQTYEIAAHFDSIATVGNSVEAIRVYRKIGTGTTYNLLTEVTNTSQTSYIDDGSAVPICDIHPPTINTTNALNKIKIETNTVTNYLDATKIRVYCTTNQGIYTAANCLVGELSMASAQPITFLYWAGAALLPGKPPAISQTFQDPAQISLDEEVEGNLPIDCLPAEFGVTSIADIASNATGATVTAKINEILAALRTLKIIGP